ncbi:MAG: exodeoxyribonuclease III [Cloacibacillus sp.]
MPLVNIGTFNINSVKSRLPILEAWLAASGAPEILALQETKCTTADFPAAAFEALGYKCAAGGMRQYNGVAVLSKIGAPEEVRFGFEDGLETARAEEEARLMRVKIGGINIINSYVPQGQSVESPAYEVKLRFFERLARLVSRCYRPDELVLWVGDMNVAPLDIDVAPEYGLLDDVMTNAEVRAAYGDVMNWGFTDLFRRFHKEPGSYSFWDYRVPNAAKRNIGWLIDRMNATAPLASRCRGVWIKRSLRMMEKPSDHTAVIGEFEMPERL